MKQAISQSKGQFRHLAKHLHGKEALKEGKHGKEDAPNADISSRFH